MGPPPCDRRVVRGAEYFTDWIRKARRREIGELRNDGDSVFRIRFSIPDTVNCIRNSGPNSEFSTEFRIPYGTHDTASGILNSAMYCVIYCVRAASFFAISLKQTASTPSELLSTIGIPASDPNETEGLNGISPNFSSFLASR